MKSIKNKIYDEYENNYKFIIEFNRNRFRSFLNNIKIQKRRIFYFCLFFFFILAISLSIKLNLIEHINNLSSENNSLYLSSKLSIAHYLYYLLSLIILIITITISVISFLLLGGMITGMVEIIFQPWLNISSKFYNSLKKGSKSILKPYSKFLYLSLMAITITLVINSLVFNSDFDSIITISLIGLYFMATGIFVIEYKTMAHSISKKSKNLILISNDSLKYKLISYSSFILVLLIFLDLYLAYGIIDFIEKIFLHIDEYLTIYIHRIWREDQNPNSHFTINEVNASIKSITYSHKLSVINVNEMLVPFRNKLFPLLFFVFILDTIKTIVLRIKYHKRPLVAVIRVIIKALSFSILILGLEFMTAALLDKSILFWPYVNNKAFILGLFVTMFVALSEASVK